MKMTQGQRSNFSKATDSISPLKGSLVDCVPTNRNSKGELIHYSNSKLHLPKQYNTQPYKK